MGTDEKAWIADAITQCEAAARAKLTIVMVRAQNKNEEADIVLTNAESPEMLRAAAKVIDAVWVDMSAREG